MKFSILSFFTVSKAHNVLGKERSERTLVHFHDVVRHGDEDAVAVVEENVPQPER